MNVTEIVVEVIVAPERETGEVVMSVVSGGVLSIERLLAILSVTFPAVSVVVILIVFDPSGSGVVGVNE